MKKSRIECIRSSVLKLRKFPFVLLVIFWFFFVFFFSFSRTFLRATCPRSRMLPVHYRKALATRFNAISRVRNLINSRCSLTVRISAPLARKFRTNVTRDKKKCESHPRRIYVPSETRPLPFSNCNRSSVCSCCCFCGAFDSVALFSATSLRLTFVDPVHSRGEAQSTGEIQGDVFRRERGRGFHQPFNGRETCEARREFESQAARNSFEREN